MSASETGLTALERNWGMVDKALEGMNDSVIAAMPNDDSNSMGWLLFHMTRIVDRFVHSWCQDSTQLWIRDGWYQKFGLSDDAENTGQGWSKEQVAAWELPPTQTLTDYYESVKTAARNYLGSLPDSGFDRELNIPPRPAASIGSFLGVMVFDNCVHGGQIAYLRGYYQGMGWFV